MFKDGVTLKKNGWVCKYLNFLLGIDTAKTFQNFCPLFWLLLGSIVLILPLLIIRLAGVFSEIDSQKWNNLNTISKVGKITIQSCKFIFAYLVCFIITLIFYIFVDVIYRCMSGYEISYIAVVALMCAIACGIIMAMWIYFFNSYDAISDNRYTSLSTTKKIVYGPSYFMYQVFKPFFHILSYPFKLLFAFIYSIYKKACPKINWR